MSIKVATKPPADFRGIPGEIYQPDARAVLYFFSPELAKAGIERIIRERFPAIPCVGASMIGGWSSEGYVQKGITAMSLSSDEIEETYVSFTTGVKADPVAATRKVIQDIKRQMGHRTANPATHVGIILFDGLCLGEEIMREISTEEDFTIPLVGGAAADELAFTETFVASGDTMSGDGMVLLVMKMKVPFYYSHSVHYQPTKTTVIVTKAEPKKRIVWEIDGKPAAPYYAKLLGLSGVDAIKHIHFSRNPLGVCIGDTVFVRSPNAVIEGTGLQFYCYIEAGTRVSLLRQGDIIEHTRSSIADARRYLPEIKGAVLFNCVLRYLEIQELKKEQEFNGLFSGYPFIGFNTYGEELFIHHNQTLTMLFIGKGTENEQ